MRVVRNPGTSVLKLDVPIGSKDACVYSKQTAYHIMLLSQISSSCSFFLQTKSHIAQASSNSVQSKMTFNLSYISASTSKVLGLQVWSITLSLRSAKNQFQELTYARQHYPQVSYTISWGLVVSYSKIERSSAFSNCSMHFQMTTNQRYLFHRAHLHLNPVLHLNTVLQ